ncbi:MAG: sigma-70 family RNA polymerase sigma factor [Chloroflexi bacterium]|nr:sigma-70 family RNA polymerase sigma factor [Chloroflexota bacterium]MCC6893386.1 sigma-70 family RNA polymerase sigma factor [Anaerolineae bacterium]
MLDRTNEQWLADLTDTPDKQSPALEDLRERLQRGIYYYLSRERSDLSGLSSSEITQMAEDLAQDATLRVMENLGSFRGDSRFTTWATKIAVRVAISDLRRARYRDFSLDDLTADGDLMPGTTNALAGTPEHTPENQTEREDVMQKISAALKDALTDRQYQALVAVALQDIPLEVVAERMGTNRNALYKLLHDARRKLRTYLETEGLSTHYMLDLFQD